MMRPPSLRSRSPRRYLNSSAADGKTAAARDDDDAEEGGKNAGGGGRRRGRGERKTLKKKKRKKGGGGGWHDYHRAQRRAAGSKQRRGKSGGGGGGGGGFAAARTAAPSPRRDRDRDRGRGVRFRRGEAAGEEEEADSSSSSDGDDFHPLLTLSPPLSEEGVQGAPIDGPYYRYLRSSSTDIYPPPIAAAAAERRRGRLVGRGLPRGDRPPFPILDASPLLDPSGYCRSSARPSGTTTISGGDAARRLSDGRRMCVDLLGGGRLTNYHGPVGAEDDCCDNNYFSCSSFPPPPPAELRAFALSGHGVPPQLLRDHVDCADGLLRILGDAAEVGFNNYRGEVSGRGRGRGRGSGRGGEEEMGLEFDWMRVRSRGGDNDPFPWPPRATERYFDPSPSEWEDYRHRVDLYLAVMNRMATALGSAVEESRRTSDDSPPEADDLGDCCDDDEYDEIDSGNDDDGFVGRVHIPRPRRWNVEFLRGFAYPPRLIPYPRGGASSDSFDAGDALIGPPIVELTQRRRRRRRGRRGRSGTTTSSSADGHVRITIQGYPSSSVDSDCGRERSEAIRRRRRRAREPLTIVFDAKFGESESETF